jgi:chemosensory pili system protein ChpB (putative protein-glutamate methylesterase)
VYANDTTKPVALLARAGAARERLREAIAAAGGHVVLEEDPNQLDGAALEAAAPQVVLVALEPAVEDALERLEPLLEAPHLTLMFEEAELAARREGWEAQRWIRHLAAKLQGHGNVLPPGQEDEAAEPAAALEPGLPERPADRHVDAPLQFHLDEAFVESVDVPADALYVPPVVPEERPQVLSFEELIATPAAVPAVLPPSLPEPVGGEQAGTEPAVQVPAAETTAPVMDFSKWSLVEEEGYQEVAATPEAPPPPALASLLNTSLSLVDIEEEGADGGAVLLFAGIGGPDAVRRVLAGLPEDFARPVLVQLRLDGGRYANLVKQMSRATSLPVSLAEPGVSLAGGNVYILPDATSLSSEGGLRFGDGQGDLLEALDPVRSAVMLLSGADVGLVEPVLAFAERGGWVAGQIGEGCYDPAAASQLAVAGKPAGDPEYLAAELATHCAG